jgi:methyltransferase (TIGR00027 family)
MEGEKASWTAEAVAFYRALESMRPEDKRVCYDPLAVEFLGRWFGLLCRNRIRARIARYYIERGKLAPSFFTLICRTTYIDDCLRRCIDDGIKQLVIFGAGFDSRAYRIGGLEENVRVFEVDHPSTQRIKIERLRRALGSLPRHVTYVPVDFESETLSRRLPESGYKSDMKTLFIWEGVTTYLTPEAVDETLSFVAGNTAEGSSIVFTYAYRFPDGTVLGERKGWHTAYMKRRGEPHIFGIEEGAIAGFLSERGFDLVANVPNNALTGTYMKKTKANTRGKEPSKRMAIAYAVVA